MECHQNTDKLAKRSSLKKLCNDDPDQSHHSSSRRSTSSSSFNVSFSSLEMRSYNVTVGDAPTSAGPPVSLDWEYDPNSTCYDVDYYESYRSLEAPRRSKAELLMPAYHRRDLLNKEWGYSRGQVDRAALEAKKVAEERKKTRQNLKLQPMEEAIETTKNKLRKLKVTLQRKKINEDGK